MKKHLTHINRLGIAALACTLFFGGLSPLRAQNIDDLLRYSVLNPSGSPRFTAMGGAFGALGGNFSALTVNPAGLGLYSRNEISLSGSVTSGNGRADYYGERHRDQELKVNLPQAGFVWAWDFNAERGLKRFQMGIGMNRINDYTGAFLVSALNSQSSYMQAVAAQNYGATTPSDNHDGTLNAPGSLAYNAYLLDGPDATGNFSTFLGGGLNQTKQWYSNGNISELSMAFSGNISDKLYVGLSFNIPFIHYYYRSTLSETVPTGSTTRYPYNFKGYDLGERFSVTGTGFTFKLGAMYQVLPYMRIGAWFHTPTYYSLGEEYTMDLAAYLTWPTDNEGNPLPGSSTGDVRSKYSYEIQTPLKAGAALGFIIGQYGVVNVEGEIVNYNGMRLKIKDDWRYEQEINQKVKDQYQVGGVLRVGTEWRAGIGRFRAGYAFNSAPFRDKSARKDWQNHTVSAGVGLAFGRWNIDFSVAYYLQKQDYYLYNIVDSETLAPLVQAANLTQNKLVYNLGFAVKF